MANFISPQAARGFLQAISSPTASIDRALSLASQVRTKVQRLETAYTTARANQGLGPNNANMPANDVQALIDQLVRVKADIENLNNQVSSSQPSPQPSQAILQADLAAARAELAATKTELQNARNAKQELDQQLQRLQQQTSTPSSAPTSPLPASGTTSSISPQSSAPQTQTQTQTTPTSTQPTELPVGVTIVPSPQVAPAPIVTSSSGEVAEKQHGFSGGATAGMALVSAAIAGTVGYYYGKNRK